jgi:hypothetical protein
MTSSQGMPASLWYVLVGYWRTQGKEGPYLRDHSANSILDRINAAFQYAMLSSRACFSIFQISAGRSGP